MGMGRTFSGTFSPLLEQQTKRKVVILVMSRYRNTKRVKQPCRVSVNQAGVVTFFAPENDKFFAAFSNAFEGSRRVWDDARKIWKIPVDSVEEMIDLLEAHYRKVEGLEVLFQSPFDVLRITPDAPNEMVKFSAKILRTRYHPDKVQPDTWSEMWPEAATMSEALSLSTDFLQQIGEAEKLIIKSREQQE